MVTVFASNTPNADASSRDSTASGDNGSSGGLETKYIAVIAVLAVVVGIAVIGILVFFLVRRRRNNAGTATSHFSGDDSADMAGGRHELDHKAKASVAELGANGRPLGAELSATGEGYRGTAAPTPWNAGAPPYQSQMSELPSQGWNQGHQRQVYEVGGNARYELR